MKHNLLLLVLMIGHMLGDFYFQPAKMSAEKNRSFSRLAIHSVIYLGGMLLAMLTFINFQVLLIALTASILHFLIDALKYFGYSIHRKSGLEYPVSKERVKTLLFFGDQFFHILSLFILSFIFLEKGFTLAETSILQEFFISVFGTGEIVVYRIILLALLLGKPTNLIVSMLFKKYKPNTVNDLGIKNAGAWIGTLERWLIAIFVALGQYAALAFVLTAKSIARYSKITEDHAFAEYYLIGTLASCLTSLAMTKLIL